MKGSYISRLTIPIDGHPTMELMTLSGEIICRGYTRVVIGDRGPYIELKTEQVICSSVYIPEDQEWRRLSTGAYYEEWRSKLDYVKLYYQRRTVDYADYKPGFWYVSPFEVFIGGRRCVME